MNPTFALHCWRRDASNFALLKYRDFDGFLVSMQNAGTQWLKYMLSLAIARQYDLPPPRYVNNASSNDLIGHPRHPRLYPQAPRIASTHSIPHYLVDSRLLRHFVRFPPYVLLVRDIRGALVSNYEKWKTRYNVPFSVYLRGDPAGHRYKIDIWWCVHFLNRWGRVCERFPGSVMVIRYEELRQDTCAELRRIFDHFGLRQVSDEAIAWAVSESSKEKMARRYNPEDREFNRSIVRMDERDPSAWFSPEDMGFFQGTLRKNLRYAFGYDYGN